MAKQVIPAFPANRDRFRFGDWLSGFVDGEGSFILTDKHFKIDDRTYFRARFCIKLRDDDSAVLKLIQSYFGCGVIYNCRVPTRHLVNSKPQMDFIIYKVSDHIRALIPHFEQHPLEAKKSRDFVIWKQGIELLARVQARKIQGRSHLGKRAGTYPKWTEPERQQFRVLCAELKAKRLHPSDLPSDSLPPQPPTDVRLRSNGHRRDDEFTLPGFSDPD